jgi:hypothetical protein
MVEALGIIIFQKVPTKGRLKVLSAAGATILEMKRHKNLKGRAWLKSGS